MNLKWHKKLLDEKNIFYKGARFIYDTILDVYPPYAMGLLLVLSVKQ
jgi:hypothetical protein